MISFNEHIEQVLLEREQDAAMFDAAEKSFQLFRAELLEAAEKMGEYFITLTKRPSPPLETDDEILRENLYLYGGQGNLLGISYVPYDARLLGHYVSKVLLKSVQGMKNFDVEESKIIGDKSLLFTVNFPRKAMVLPKNVKGISQGSLNRLFGDSQSGNLKVTVNTKEIGSDLGVTVAGTYRSPIIRTKDHVYKLGDARINLSKFTSFSPEIVQSLMLTLMRNGNKPNICRREVREWVSLVDIDLRKSKGTYVHEYTHFLDNIRMGDVLPKNVSKGTEVAWDTTKKWHEKGAYYKSDIEWNAHFTDTASAARFALRDFLIAMQSNAVAMSVFFNNNALTEVGKGYILKPELKGSLGQVGRMMKEKIESSLEKLLRDELGRRYKRFIDLLVQSNPQGPQADEARRFLPIFSQNINNLKGLLFLFVLELFLANKEIFLDFMISDPKFKNRFYTRIYSTGQDLEKEFNRIMGELQSGKFPSKQAWSKAIGEFYTIRTDAKWIPSNADKAAYSKHAHGMLYSGAMMKSLEPHNGPFDPNKPISSELLMYRNWGA
jgi:hypothetical protein